MRRPLPLIYCILFLLNAACLGEASSPENLDGDALTGPYSLLTTQTPRELHLSDGTSATYELATGFLSTQDGQVTALRYYKDSRETGAHTGHLWSASGQLLATVTFSGETASGWQTQALAAPVKIAANTNYFVSVNTGGTYYVATNNGFSSQVHHAALRSVVGQNGRYGAVGQFPTRTWEASNYFRDVVFTAAGTSTNPPPGAPTISSFTAAPPTVAAGASSTLAFSVANATSLMIDNGVGTVTGKTSTVVTPSQTTTYVLTATNSTGSVSNTVTVTVTGSTGSPPPPPPAAGSPALFFSDITSGPSTGGENNGGAFVTVYGAGFGASQGSSTVTVGGSAVAGVKVWGASWNNYQKIAFQLGANNSTGNIIVTVNGKASNPLPFTVRAGNIYFVATSGNDSNAGSAAAPFKSLQHGRDRLAEGDIVYIEDGVSVTSQENYNSVVWMGDSGSGTAEKPKALLTYPGAHVTLGNGNDYSLRGSDLHGANDYWVVGGFKMLGTLELDSIQHWNVIANEVTCPGGSGQSACVHVETSGYINFLGNYVHDVGNTAGSIDKYYHAVYFTTNTNHVWVGWNTIVPNPTHSTSSGGCRGLQFYSTGGSDQYDLHVHDNVIHDAICDGINLATVNADQGPVEVYNNLVYHVGTGPDPSNGSSNYACVNLGSSGSPATNVELFNNTLYDCGKVGSADSGGFTLYAHARVRNNVVSQVASNEHYFGSNAGCGFVTGSNNLWFGAGAAPGCSGVTAGQSVDPAFINPGQSDFHLGSSSPAKDSGVSTTASTDLDGTARPQGSAFDIGAYEYFTP